MSLSSFAQAALAIVQESGSLVRAGIAQPHQIRRKGPIDLVTETDLAVESFLKERLADLKPEGCAGAPAFLAEESAEGFIPPDCCWIIDPVDGTTNYAHGFPVVGTSVAWYADGAVQLGIVNAPLLNECYVAETGRGAWCNGQRLQVSGVQQCAEALVATGFPYTIQTEIDRILDWLRPVLLACQGVRRCGAAALDLAWVAAGRLDAYYEINLKPWDVAAGWLLVNEARGRVTTMSGAPYAFGEPVLASNGLVHEAMLTLLSGTGR